MWKLHSASNMQNSPYATTKSDPNMPASIRFIHQYSYKLPPENENDYNELFVLALTHLFPMNLNINS
jgi:hypothetical protein